MSAIAGILGCLLLVLIPLAFVGGIVYLIVWFVRRNRAARQGEPMSAGGLFLVVALGVGAGFGVLAFLGIIAAILIPNLSDALQKAKQKRTLADLGQVSRVLEEYRSQEGSYPAAETADELLASLSAAGFVEGFTVTDGWGNPISYRCWEAGGTDGPCTDFLLTSAGADGLFQGEEPAVAAGADSLGPYDGDLVVGPLGVLKGPDVSR